jgi:hypothetical protein
MALRVSWLTATPMMWALFSDFTEELELKRDILAFLKMSVEIITHCRRCGMEQRNG